jgi:hypothetical protein
VWSCYTHVPWSHKYFHRRYNKTHFTASQQILQMWKSFDLHFTLKNVKSRLRAFLNSLYKKSWGIAQTDQKPAETNDRAANRTLSFKTTFI